MLNRVKDYFKHSWRAMPTRKKKRIIGLIERMENEIDLIEREVT